MLALIKVGLSPAICVLAATLGNTAGGMTCYYMGRLGKTDWIEKYFKVKKEKIDKMQRFLQGKGALMAFLPFCLYRGSHCHSIGLYAQQCHADYFFYVCRQADTIYCYVIGLTGSIISDECLEL